MDKSLGGRVLGVVSAFIFATSFVLSSRAASADAVEQPNLQVMLDWVIQGTHAPFFVAENKGYFKAEGLTVRFDPGKGAGTVCSTVAGGVYHMGYADIPTLVQFNAQNPDKGLLAVYVSFDETPLALVGLKKNGINTVQDLNGKRVAAPANSAMTYSLPVMLKAAHAENVQIVWQYVAPQLMAPMLVKGETDLLGGFTNSQIVAVRELGVKRDDISVMKFADTLNMYGLAIVVPKKFADDNPRTVAAFVRALNKGTKDTVADPKAAIALMKQRDPMMNTDLEFERLQIALGHTVTKHVREAGLSSVTVAGMQETIDDVAAAMPLPHKPTVAEIWTDRFLPPVADRKLPPMTN
jgi:NitT/TauT family transport system substrate-binding protein